MSPEPAGDVLMERLGRPGTVELAELEATAALLARRDRKYIVPLPVAVRLADELAAACRVLEIGGRRRFRYESVYFDTPDAASYLASARGRPRRYKVRTRTYLDSGRCLLEVKVRAPRGRTLKVRHEHPIAHRGALDPAARAFAGACPLIGPASATLAPALATRYARATLLVGSDRARVTIDTDVEACAPDGRVVALVGMAIVETKSGGPPSEADRILWDLGHRPTRVSKYCTSLAALHPHLPANRWTRALRQPWCPGDGRAPWLIPGAAWPLALAG
jgi:hypothetical protein